MTATVTQSPTGSDKHTISLLVHNRPGVLSRIAQVFARRGYNIDSLVVSPSHRQGFSRMTIACQGDPAVLDQIIKQCDKLVDTVRAVEHTTADAVEREMALFKVAVTPETRAELFQLVEVFRGKTVDVSETTLTVELTGSSDKLDAFENLVNRFGIVEMVRSGKLVIARGPEPT